MSESEFSWVHSQGYNWFHKVFMPALEQSATLSLVSKETLSSCYYLAGDVNDVNDAPNKALEYYHKALNFDPYCGATHREIGTTLYRLGKTTEAIEYLDKAIALDPDDTHAIHDREYMEDDNFALYEDGDVLWNVGEHLANAEPSKALSIVDDMKDIIGLRAKLYCYGALGETDKYLKTWSDLTQISDQMDLGYVDWFYMPDHVYESPEIWTILLSSKTKFDGAGTFFDSLENNMTYRNLTGNDKMRLSFQYHKYTSSKNHDTLKQLSAFYPEWVELKEHF